MWKFISHRVLCKIKFGCGGHLGRRSEMPDTILEGNHPRIISAKFGWDWPVVWEEKTFFKFHLPFFLFLAWRPSWLEVGITGHNFGRGSSKDHSTKVWLQLAQWFLRRLKCEMLTDGRRTKSDGNIKARWAKNDSEISMNITPLPIKLTDMILLKLLILA